DSKPTMKKFQNLSQKFYKNWPYEMWAYSIPKALLNNLNVGYYLIYNNKLGENKLYDYVDENGWWYYASRPVESLEKIKSDHYAKYFQKEDYKIYDLDTPMPYIYFQDKIYSADLNEQFKKLLYSDLRTGAFALSDYTGIVPFQYEDFESSANTTKDFEKLQKKFQILKINMNKNNKLTLTVSAERPVLMIRNEAYHEGWKVKINKKKGNIIQINYLQQGVYLNKGINEISFTFFPKNLYYGIIISLFFLIIFVGVTLGVVLQKILRK
ncbi:MAG: YfhO family protein, partial [Spirochaetes bacterium]|nr:YfhO family protein [Spirochaetota bacterium]